MTDNLASPPTSPAPPYYVGIGASAGGLEALEAFFNNMPADSGLAFVVVQHLSPDYKSMMVELLSKRTAMKVCRAEEGMRVEANTVYLIPPKKQLTIFHEKLILTDIDHGKGINLPIDVFLRSLAEDQAEKAIAVILSGTGSDGVRGIRSIKEAGGMVMVQSQESAKFDGMPRAAIDTGLTDVILPPEEMPARLLDFVRRTNFAPAERSSALLSDEDGLTRIFALLREHSKLDFTFYKPSTVLRRIERRISVNQAADLRDYVRLLESSPSEVTTLYRELLIGVTSFFRDREVFDMLAETFLPALLDEVDDRDELRFWIAGCSTGEEAYTLAILARECMEKSGRHIHTKIFATDIDRDAILRAGNGIFSESIAADLPPGILNKYFIHRDNEYHIQRAIREMVVFAQHNIIKDPPFTNIDLISCRNLLIYLQPILQQKVFEYLNFSLNPHGILLLGTSETPGDMADYFEVLHGKNKLYRSRGRKRQNLDERPLFSPMVELARHNSNARLARGLHANTLREEERLLERLLETLSEEFLPMVAVVNERMELLHLTGDGNGLLRLPVGKQVNDITRMAERELSIPLATGLQKVFGGQREVRYTNIRLSGRDGSRLLQMDIRQMAGKRGQEPMAAVVLRDMPKLREEVAGEVPEVYDLSREAEQRIRDLESELQFTKENLQATIEELETSNEELQATNEELLASNEELQSTNEELQSVNEELHTVNAEYQTKIIELTEMTNDMENLLAATGVATLFLDENLDIRKFTPELTNIFRVISADIGRPLTHIVHTLVSANPAQMASQVMTTSRSLEQVVRTQAGAKFLMRVLPYKIGSSSPAGVLMVFVDIGPLMEAESDLREALDTMKKMQRMAGIGDWRLDLRANRLSWSDEVFRIFGLKPQQFPATYQAFLDAVHPDDRDKVDAAYRNAIQQRGHYDIIHRILRPDGSVRVVHEVSEQVFEESGEAVASIGIIHDVTDCRGLLCNTCPLDQSSQAACSQQDGCGQTLKS